MRLGSTSEPPSAVPQVPGPADRRADPRPMTVDPPDPSIHARRTPDSSAMALPRHQLSRLSSEVQLPILAPDVYNGNVESGMEPEVDTQPAQPKPQPPSGPQHPIPSMQQAFAESLVEATQEQTLGKPRLRTGDDRARREELLDGERLDPPPTALWRRRPGQVTHELCRLMAQISFGVYLLLNGMANDQPLVIFILQGHINEVDEFLETTLEDMNLATRDMEERIKHLKLPMDNIAVFERMLEDATFRMQIMDGNQKIEHILARTQVALQQMIEDVSEGLTATREFTNYLRKQERGSWKEERPDVLDIFGAMKGNTDGWSNAFEELEAKSSSLDAMIARLTDIVSEMDRRVGEVDRKARLSLSSIDTAPQRTSYSHASQQSASRSHSPQQRASQVPAAQRNIPRAYSPQQSISPVHTTQQSVSLVDIAQHNTPRTHSSPQRISHPQSIFQVHTAQQAALHAHSPQQSISQVYTTQQRGSLLHAAQDGSASYRSSKHSPRPSDGSFVRTPSASPPRSLSGSPPRLSLHLSTIGPVNLSLSPQPGQAPPAQEPLYEEPGYESRPQSLMVTSRSPPPESPSESSGQDTPAEELSVVNPLTEQLSVENQAGELVGESSEASVKELDESSVDISVEKAAEEAVGTPVEKPAVEEEPVEEPPMCPPARNPRRLSQRPAALLDLPKLETPENDAVQDEESSLYMLQPRTYTPRLPPPQPSPRVLDPRPEYTSLPPAQLSPSVYNPRLEHTAQLPPAQLSPSVYNPRLEHTPQLPPPQLSPSVYNPRLEHAPQLPSPQPSPRVVNPRPESGTESRNSRIKSSTSSIVSAAQLTLEPATPRVEQVLPKPQQFRPKVVEINRDSKPPPRLSERPVSRQVSRPDPAQAPELVIPQDPEVVPMPRTSLRQRVSLRRDLPQSIQVPPPSIEIQPRLRAIQRTSQALDSAYASDMERPPVHSMASIGSSLAEFPMPFVQPGMIPSPHSERQFFRPVQASPYSPLQQRPHTSGTVGPHHFPAPPRNTPSAMGMSMMSNGTATSGRTAGGKSVKKKRSAFGWLKKAFSLDEEERAAFEQRRTEQMANPYYEAKSQQFLDGRRIRPRPGY